MSRWNAHYIKHYDVEPKFLSHSNVRYSDSGEYASQIALVKLPHGWTLRDLQEWAAQEFDTHCQHSYDCCGHWYSYLSTYDATRHKGRTYYVRIRYSQNI